MFLYQYGVGLLVFFIGLFFAFKHGYIGLSGRRAVNLGLVCLVLLVCLGGQAWLQFGSMEEAPAVPYTGEVKVDQRPGTALDYGIMIGYFLIILAIGTFFGRRQRTLKDFFFGGQRFSWWLITFSLVATVIGSYSFVKYSTMGYRYGLGSAQTYTNDWIWLPLLIFGWLPILYFSRITSIPEYFERRFDRRVRGCVTVLVLVYLIGYVGVNLFTMGKVLNILLGWPIWTAAVVVASISAIYVTAGGQTSVIMTDLFQGLMLVTTGCVLLFLGIDYMGGFSAFFDHLPRGHRFAFPNFNEDAAFPSVGIFWQDGIANTAMFYFLNQGVIMRFLSARSVQDGRKAMFAVVLVLMPIAAIVVGCGGWIAKALVHAGVLPPDIAAGEAFFIASDLLSRPGMFGLILATLTAALMSTVDTLITAVAAIAVNDVYKPFVRPDADEKHLLKVARVTSVGVTLVGILLVPLFMSFKTIYEAHGAFTAAVTPPLVVALMLSVFWRRFTRAAALATLVGGTALIVLSIFVPQIITPFAHGVPMTEGGDGLLSGMAQYKFMRAFFGVVVCLVLGVTVSLLTRPESEKKRRGLVWGTLADAIRHYKGSPGREVEGQSAPAAPRRGESEPPPRGEALLPEIALSAAVAGEIGAEPGDLLYVTDRRGWLGGLRSIHAVLGRVLDGRERVVEMGPETFSVVVAPGREGRELSVQRLY